MESLWRTHVLSKQAKDLLCTFESSTGGVGAPCTALRATSAAANDEPSLEKKEARSDAEWRRWFQHDAFRISGQEAAFAAVLVPRARPPANTTARSNLEHMAILEHFPFSEASFDMIIDKLRVHRAFAILVQRGTAILCRVPATFQGIRCQVYVLRVQHTLTAHTAMSITHIPGDELSQRGRKTYVTILGCSAYDREEIFESLKCLPHSIFSPFTAIKVFLELERERRFAEVDTKTRDFERVIENYNTAIFPKSKGPPPLGTQPRDMIDLYLETTHLKNGLIAWKTQIASFRRFSDDFRAAEDEIEDIDPDEYLQILVDEYDTKINKCEMVLQGASLTFQMETARLSRQDAKLAQLDTRIALRDGKQMKAIALLTMVFLPGTFVATVLAVPDVDEVLLGGYTKWQWYLILFFPLTVVVMFAYFLWVQMWKPKDLLDPALGFQ